MFYKLLTPGEWGDPPMKEGRLSPISHGEALHLPVREKLAIVRVKHESKFVSLHFCMLLEGKERHESGESRTSYVNAAQP